MKDNITLVRQIFHKLDEIGWAVDMYREPSTRFWTCKIWKKEMPEAYGAKWMKSYSAAGMTRLSAIHAAMLEVIRNA